MHPFDSGRAADQRASPILALRALTAHGIRPRFRLPARESQALHTDSQRGVQLQVDAYLDILRLAINCISDGTAAVRPLASRHEDMFKLRQGRHLIIFRMQAEDQCLVVRVLHERMDIDARLGEAKQLISAACRQTGIFFPARISGRNFPQENLQRFLRKECTRSRPAASCLCPPVTSMCRSVVVSHCLRAVSIDFLTRCAAESRSRPVASSSVSTRSTCLGRSETWRRFRPPPF